MPTRGEVYEAIDGERAYQAAQGAPHILPSLPLPGHLLAMQKLLKDAVDTWYGSPVYEPQFETLALVRKVTALGVSAMELYGAPRRGQTPLLDKLIHAADDAEAGNTVTTEQLMEMLNSMATPTDGAA